MDSMPNSPIARAGLDEKEVRFINFPGKMSNAMSCHLKSCHSPPKGRSQVCKGKPRTLGFSVYALRIDFMLEVTMGIS
jgi:hypothetical protein